MNRGSATTRIAYAIILGVSVSHRSVRVQSWKQCSRMMDCLDPYASNMHAMNAVLKPSVVVDEFMYDAVDSQQTLHMRHG